MMNGIETIYAGGDSCITYLGVKFHLDFMKKYIPSRVGNRFFDIKGTDELINEFDDLINTGFEKEALIDIFKLEKAITYWKIGESLAECYLEDYKGVRFHYNSIRDAKNPNANLTGADLVGFIDINNETIFLFGEVKTSSDDSTPPQILYGRSGMIKQLEKIKSNYEVKNSLVRWLGFKVKDLSDDHPFREDYKKALTLYIKSKQSKINLIGILVRDTSPTDKDLKTRLEELKRDVQEGMNIELIALYVPIPVKELELLLSSGGEGSGT
ncbi:MAG: hypothetical protein HXS54_11575 [Theionarchaea archaeon]|nr:hypothetical protein [Theionarchaea archaeon]